MQISPDSPLSVSRSRPRASTGESAMAFTESSNSAAACRTFDPLINSTRFADSRLVRTQLLLEPVDHLDFIILECRILFPRAYPMGRTFDRKDLAGAARLPDLVAHDTRLRERH